MINLNKLVTGTSIVFAVVSAATVFGASELEDAVAWGYENELTRYNTVDSFMPYNTLTREQGAKFFSAFATLNLCKEPDSNADCEFSDLDNADHTLRDYIVLACQLGLFKGSNGRFMPKAPFLKSEVITVLMRALDGMQDESVTPWWKNYFLAAREAGITKETSAEALARPVQRYEALLMMYRAKSDECDATSDDLQKILDNLFGQPEDKSSNDTTDTNNNVTTNGSVRCVLSSDTPPGTTIPHSVSVKVATYECEAVGQSATIDGLTLERQGLSDNTAIDKLSVFANEDLVAKGKSFNTNAIATFSLSPKVNLGTGAKVKFHVVAKVGSSSNNQRFKIALKDFTSNVTKDTSNLPVVANQFEIVNITPATLEVKSVGVIPNVRLGQKGVRVARFQLKNTTADNVDVKVNQIVLRDLKSNADEDLMNVVLRHNGNTVATIADPTSKNLTFVLTNPVVVQKGKTEVFEVVADIVQGAGDQIEFTINNEVYVLGTDSRHGYGVKIVWADTTYVSQLFTITAGKVTLTKLANPSKLARIGKQDVVLAHVMLTSNESQNLTIEDVKFVWTKSFAWQLNTCFDNPELRVIQGNSSFTYALQADGADNYKEDDLSISLPASGSITLQLVADVKNSLPGGTCSFTFTDTFSYSLTAPTNLKIIENDDDQQVNDIVPSSVVFDSMKFASPQTQISNKPLANITVVKGAANVEAFRFDLLTDETSAVRYDSFKVSPVSNFDSTHVAAVRLYRGSYPNGTLIDEQSSFTNGDIIFNNLNLEVPAKSTQPMYITIDTVGNAPLNSIQFKIPAGGIVARDAEDNDLLTVQTLPLNSRIVTLSNAPTLSCSMNVIDAKVNKDKVLLWGVTSSEVAAVEFHVTNDSILLKNLKLGVIGTTNFDDIVSNVMLLSVTGGVVDPYAEVIDNTSVSFNNIDLVLTPGTHKFYVKVLPKSIGYNKETGTETNSLVQFTFVGWNITAQSNTDGSAVTLQPSCSWGSPSNGFFVRSVKVSNVSLATVGASLPEGTSPKKKVASITFVADNSSNVHPTNGWSLKASVQQLKLTFGGVIAGAVPAGGVEIRDSANVLVMNCNYAFNVATCTPVSPTLALFIDQGSTSTYYVYVATNTWAPYTTNNNDTLTIGIANLDSNDVIVQATDSSGSPVYTPQVGLYLPNMTNVPAVTITE